ncbi:MULTISPECIES: hypothetical protein [Alkalihalophilus]|uniref:Uncharacterized protein n=2 Tax=Alkalihalophilus pseudofirmus TaxID=79885 RepID=D3FSH1_ALKPO|nr:MULTISPECIES: hypothetical protein [Alkalihalophilus]ADC49939.1 hypothetical protein BpOF4_09420 [Alkalihalophilus pseudofirmus OF4]MDV2887167.1 hypothetical protein [Alkalihalophilus pseudofirmus]MEC2071046.1 hypothetical protein [Alkalihalophilus marmarensis]MED1602058.1 hypothetical protein [Alkalihalophilus marmarensis]OLS34912.1 hypothetical protein BTR22_17155 [Alkalihalophilus pseudofirmus]
MKKYKVTFYFCGGESVVFELESGYELNQQIDKIQTAKWFDHKNQYINMENVERFEIEEH